MPKGPIAKITIVGDSTGGQKSLKDLGSAATQSEVSIAGFGKAFLKLGAVIGGAALLKQGADAVVDYAKKVKDAEIDIYALTKSQTAVAEAQRIANREMEAGRAAFSDTMTQLAALTPLANQSGQSIDGLYKTAQQLATLNSGPEGGVSGAIVAMGNALSGDWSSAIDRFNLPRQMINDLKAQGVPALEIFTRALAASGVTMDTVTAQSKKADVQQKILTDSIAKLGAEAGGQQGIAIWTTALIGLNKVAQSGAVKEFAERLNYLLSVAVSAEGFSQISIDVRKSIYLILYAFNDLLEAFSFGKLSLKTPLANMRAEIVADEGKLRQTIDEHIGKPIQEGFDKATKPPPAQVAKITGYGREMLRALVKGLTAEQVDASAKISGVFADLFNGTDGKADPDKVAAGQAAIALALRDIARDGTIASDTMMDLSSAFGLQAPEVQKLIDAYAQLNRAQAGIAAANTKVAAANAALSVVNAQATGETKRLEAALTSAQQAAAAHAQETADALEPLQDALDGVRRAAEESGRASAGVITGLQSELEGLQNQASANAAGFQQQINEAQAQYEQAQTRRQQLQGALQAALDGELATYLRINDIQDESIRKIAEKWDAEIAGARRAKEGTNDKVTGLNRAANKEDLDYLQKIQSARSGGNEKEARRLERELAARQKQRQAALTLAQAEARVANDNFDEAADQLAKEGKKQDEIEGNKEKAAGAEVKRIQTAAAEQKAADDAAIAAKNEQIKAVQQAQTAEQDRYAAQQRGIQAEIDKVNAAAKVQAAKDKKTIDDAQTILADRKTFWDQELTKAGENLTQRQNEATAAANIAADSKTSYEWLERITKLDFQNVLDAAKAAKDLANQPPPPPLDGGGARGGGRDERAGTGDASGAPTTGKPGTSGGGPLPRLLSGDDYLTAPAGYHAEYDDAGALWYVANGYNLNDYGKHQGAAARNDGGDGTSLSAAGVGGPKFLRTAGIGGGAGLAAQAAAPGDDRGGLVVNIHAPNLRDLGSKQDQRDLAAIMRRELNSAIRGGLDPGKVNA